MGRRIVTVGAELAENEFAIEHVHLAAEGFQEEFTAAVYQLERDILRGKQQKYKWIRIFIGCPLRDGRRQSIAERGFGHPPMIFIAREMQLLREPVSWERRFDFRDFFRRRVAGTDFDGQDRGLALKCAGQ